MGRFPDLRDDPHHATARGSRCKSGADPQPGAPLLENLHRFGIYTLLTSTGGWDTGRAITNGLAIALLGPAVLTTLRRAARKAQVVRTVSAG